MTGSRTASCTSPWPVSIARSSNIGTALAATQFQPPQLYDYLRRFDLGTAHGRRRPGRVDRRAAAPRLVELRSPGPRWPSDRASPSTPCRWRPASTPSPTAGELITPSLIEGSETTNSGADGRHGDDDASPRRQRLGRTPGRRDDGDGGDDPDVGTAPGAGIVGYRVAGKTGTAQEVGGRCSCYKDGGLDVSFAGFAPADNPRFTVYAVVKHPRPRSDRWRHRRPGLPQGAGLRAAEVRRRAHRHHAAEHPGPVEGTALRPHRDRRTPPRLRYCVSLTRCPSRPSTRPSAPPRTPLAQVAEWARGADSCPRDAADVVVTGLTPEQPRVRPGDLYAALPGSRVHGATYVPEAVAAGAVAVLTDPAGAGHRERRRSAALLVLEDPRGVLGPSRRAASTAIRRRSLTLMAVTGTQGKTTTTRLLEGGPERGRACRAAVIGTVGTRIAGRDGARPP